MSEHDRERLLDLNAKMLAALCRVQLSVQLTARIEKGVRTVAALSPETMQAVGKAIIKAERANDERA